MPAVDRAVSLFRVRRVIVALEQPSEARRVAAAFAEEAPKAELVVCGSIDEVLEAQQAPADVVIAELHLPDGDATRLLGQPARRQPVVILLPPGEVGEGLAEGIDDDAWDWAVKTPALLDALPHVARSAAKEWSEYHRRRAAEDNLRHADRLATVGRIAAGVIHEVGTPLNVIRMQAQLLALDPSDVQAASEQVIEQCDRIASILRQTLNLSRARGAGRERVDLHGLADRAVTLLAPTLRRGHVRASVEGEPATVMGDADALFQVVLNLLTNALDAMPDGGRVTLTVGHGADTAVLTVRDRGTGIDPAQLDALFAAFFTTKPPGKGTGLGLHVSTGIVAEHHGTLTAANHPDGGAIFTLTLPAAPARG